MGDAFDRAWSIAKNEAEDEEGPSKFGDKFDRKLDSLKEGGRSLPEDTKFSDLRSTSGPPYMNVDRYQPKSVVPDIMDLLSGAGSEREVEPFGGSEFAMRPTSGKFMNDYTPFQMDDILSVDAPYNLPEMPEGEPINIFDLENFRPSQTEIDNNAVVDAIMRDIDMSTGGSSAPNPFIPDNIKYPKSLIDRAKKQSGMPQPDIETEEFEA